MSSALIGWSGFVGSTLLSQGFRPSAQFRANDIEQVRNRHFDLVVCAGAPAEKWWANQNAAADRANLHRLQRALETLTCERFVLISTVDVYALPDGVDEGTEPSSAVLQPYGLHRLELEQFVKARFVRHHVVRLPGLVGEGLKKNAVFDLARRRRLETLDPRARQQYYPMDRLFSDIERTLGLNFPLVHLVAEPINLGTVANTIFGIHLEQPAGPAPQAYDVRTRHAADFGPQGHWQVPATESLVAIARYASTIRGTMP